MTGRIGRSHPDCEMCRLLMMVAALRAGMLSLSGAPFT
jgi:hypothetical protein